MRLAFFREKASRLQFICNILYSNIPNKVFSLVFLSDGTGRGNRTAAIKARRCNALI